MRLKRSSLHHATFEDALDVATLLRETDRHEVAATTGRNPFVMTLKSHCEAYAAWAMRDVCGWSFLWFGVAAVPDHPGVGVVGLLATDEFRHHVSDILRAARPVLREVKSLGFASLTNWVWEGNAAALRFAERFGFRVVERREKFGPGDEPFVRIWRDLRDV